MLGGSTNIRLQFSQKPAKIGLEWPGFLAPRPEDSSHTLLVFRHGLGVFKLAISIHVSVETDTWQGK